MKQNQKTTWVLVADEAIARVLELARDGQHFKNVEEVTDKDAHTNKADMRWDAEGRRSAGAVDGNRGTANVTASAGENEEHLEAARFAHTVSALLTTAFNEHRYTELRIVAAPRFLGLLRKALHANVSKVVTEESSKDLVHMTNDEIARHILHTKASENAA